MNLAVDIGNSRTKLAVFDGADLVTAVVEEGEIEPLILQLKERYPIENCILSSVRQSVPDLGEELNVYTVGEDDLILPMKIDYETIETLGNDRIAAAVGAASAFPGQTVLVIDAGTCMTYDFVTDDGVFRGGNIAPGLRMRLRAMHEQTGRLPLVDVAEPKRTIGKSTREAMLNGAALGIDLEIEGYQRYAAEHFDLSMTVITGGDGEYFAERSKTEIFVRPNLVLEGLNEILKVNAG